MSWLHRQDRAGAERAWRELLAGVDEPTLVAPEARGRMPVRSLDVTVELPEDLTTRLAAVARANELTMNTLVQGAWAMMLGRLTGRTDVVFGTTVSGRPPELAGMASMLGMFVDTMPVRVRLDPATPVVEVLHRPAGPARQDGPARPPRAGRHPAAGRPAASCSTR